MLAATLNELHETRCEQQRTQDTVEKVVSFLSTVVDDQQLAIDIKGVRKHPLALKGNPQLLDSVSGLFNSLDDGSPTPKKPKIDAQNLLDMSPGLDFLPSPAYGPSSVPLVADQVAANPAIEITSWNSGALLPTVGPLGQELRRDDSNISLATTASGEILSALEKIADDQLTDIPISVGLEVSTDSDLQLTHCPSNGNLFVYDIVT